MIEMKLDEEGRILASPRLRAKKNGQPIWYIVAGPENAISAHRGGSSCFAANFKALKPEDTKRILEEVMGEWK